MLTTRDFQVDETLLEQQQSAYKVAGVDENEPVPEAKKRKAEGEDTAKTAKVVKKTKTHEPRPNTAIWVTGLPKHLEVQDLKDTFTKYGGVIEESMDTQEPRIKMYRDEEGQFKGEALIIFYRPESVSQAVSMLDDGYWPGEPASGDKVNVEPADKSYKEHKENGAEAGGAEREKKKNPVKRGKADLDKINKHNAEMKRRVTDWSDDEEPQTLPEVSNRWDKVVVLKQMFTLKELEEDPSAATETKEDILAEAEKFGPVTNIVLYDREEDGVVTLRFNNSTAAKACVDAFDGRHFDQRVVEASIAGSKTRFKKSRDVVEVDEEDKEDEDASS